MTSTGQSMELLTAVEKRIQEDSIKNIRFEFLDTNAVARSKTIPAHHFKSTATSGVLFPGFCFSWTARSDIPFESSIAKKYHCSDLVFLPDLSTFEVLPWTPNTARVFVSVSDISDDEKALIDPRNVARAQLEKLKDRDLSIFSSFEYEFWVVDEENRKPIIDGVDCYATIRLAKHQAFFDKVAENLSQAGVDIECVETEYAKGQFELVICPTFGIKAADNAATFRTGVKEMAMQNGFVASFMSKPYPEEEGSSGHFNHSLWSLDGKTPKTGDPSRPYGLSEIGEHWIAGLLEHAPALSFLQSPTVNCRDRVKPDTFAPFNATWGVDNRTCAVRLKPVGAHGIYMENRMGSSAGNPYISLAATIAAGIDGIERKLPLPPPVPTNKPSHIAEHVPPDTALLPADMEAPFQALKKDEILVSAIGADLVDALESVRRLEMTTFAADSDVEKFELHRRMYFDYV
ncbi:lengsin-like [Apostichopus japonicus]|uniref:lengsin-like n=1 Tax=Stichopus japonicus TaxID=307972 RepID=UPI003AB6F08C